MSTSGQLLPSVFINSGSVYHDQASLRMQALVSTHSNFALLLLNSLVSFLVATAPLSTDSLPSTRRPQMFEYICYILICELGVKSVFQFSTSL